MSSAKKHIEAIVKHYIALYPEEFEQFKEGMTMVRAALRDAEYGTSLGKHGSSETRALYEMPETLHEMLIMGLEEEEMLWLKAGGKNRKEGGQWFAKTFRDFAIPSKI